LEDDAVSTAAVEEAKRRSAECQSVGFALSLCGRKQVVVLSAAFLLTLESKRSPASEKALIIRALDEWEVLTPTWFEVADYLPTIERLHEDPSFAERDRAALLASKVAYCLCDYKGALKFALAAGSLCSRCCTD
jgi:hypothetical protein